MAVTGLRRRGDGHLRQSECYAELSLPVDA